MKRFLMGLLVLPFVGTQSRAQDTTAARALAADTAWREIESLISPIDRLTGVLQDSDLTRRYVPWNETRKQLLRAIGEKFVDRFPEDAHVCQWLIAAEVAEPTTNRYKTHQRPHAPLIGDFLEPVYADSVTTRLEQQWKLQLPVLQARCLQSASPDSMRVQIAFESVEQQIRPVELDLWFPPDTLHPTQADTIHWNDLSQAVLGMGKQFPSVTNTYVRDNAISLLDLLHKYHPVGEADYLAALQHSPNASLRELGRAQEALAEARRTPLEMHVTGIDGKTIDLKQLRGKLVLLDFWAASWCSACRIQEPLIKAAYEKYHDKGLEIVGVALEDNAHRKFFTQYLKENGITWPQYFPGGSTPTDNLYFRRFGFDGAPQLLLLDRNGLLIGEQDGSAGIQKMEPLIKTQLGLPHT